MPRILAIDYGIKRTGIAVTDPLQIIASALETVPTHQLETFLDEYLQKEEVEKIIVGLPLKGDNEFYEIENHIRGFIKRFSKKHPDISIERADERFTSKMAFDTILQSGIKKKKRRDKSLIDKVSAAILLQEYLQNI
ncbi:MAG: Holliday junction resolvase RuvX [Bacteroidetes bacterium]|nr:MAG: Holliday junction resolvase RuvX [Bacteroidota bacterium]